MPKPIRQWITKDHRPVTQWPNFDSEIETAVLQVLRDGNISSHPIIREFESTCCHLFQRKHAIAHNNGTSGLLAAFHALGLQPGDEILVQSATFWASVLPMVWCGLVPVFCESEPTLLGIDPIDAERRISTRTRAIVVVHLWGLPCDMKGVHALANKHDLKIIEDASHSHGASWQQKPCGALGDISVFSFQGDKLAPAGEGGVFLTDNEEYFERAIGLGDIRRINELPSARRRFAATSMGIKTRMAPLSAAVGHQMLLKLTDNNALRNANHEQLAEALAALGFDCFAPAEEVKRVYFEFIIRHRDPNFDSAKLVAILKQMGAHVDWARYPLLHQQPFFTEGKILEIGRYPDIQNLPDYTQTSLPITERENNRLIRLPNFPNKDNGILAQYAQAFAAGLDHISSS